MDAAYIDGRPPNMRCAKTIRSASVLALDGSSMPISAATRYARSSCNRWPRVEHPRESRSRAQFHALESISSVRPRTPSRRKTGSAR